MFSADTIIDNEEQNVTHSKTFRMLPQSNSFCCSSNTNNDGSIGDGDGVVVGSDGVDKTTEKLKPLFKSTTTSRTTTTTAATTTPSVATTVATTAGSEQKESQSQPRKLKHLGRWSKILFF